MQFFLNIYITLVCDNLNSTAQNKFKTRLKVERRKMVNAKDLL